MKIFALYLFSLLISFDTFAFENAGMTTGYFQQHESKAGGPSVNVRDVRMVALTQANTTTGTQEQVGAEPQDEFATEISIYALIILVYSIHWLQNYERVKRSNAKHKILGRDTDLNGQRAE
ncbi:MAG: hypothetical protein IPN42_05485 [Methylococcaceae bacterium]|nr:hypothetical protein [Methylococcaceae bacterium]